MYKREKNIYSVWPAFLAMRDTLRAIDGSVVAKVGLG